ncbi:hypothetical protein KAX17_03740 [Candidatus Bipolaricaulota bacterium]|nr:hypothetical protein [Candidatus Bipolaricaulota bacterium]
MNLPDIIRRNLWLLVTFAVYVLGICVFGVIYYGLYRRKPLHFSFIAGISETQHLSLMEEAKNELEISQVKADILTRLMEILQNDTYVSECLPRLEATKKVLATPLAKPNILTRFIYFLTDETAYIRKNRPLWDDWIQTVIHLEDGSRVSLGIAKLGPGDIYVPEMTLFDSQGSNLGRWHEDGRYSDFDIDGLRRLAGRHLAAVEDAAARCRGRLDSLAEPLPRIWSFRDFLYFSIVTQTTLGYGDILPNSSTVRSFVAIQVLLGLALLVVIINMVVSG